MPDNPRIPGNPSEMSSSGSKQDHHQHPLSERPVTPTPTHSSISPQARNIIIGGLVTIASSVLIYYLTVYQNKPKGSEAGYLERKEATLSAWKSYVTFENLYTKNTLTFEKEASNNGGMDHIIKGFRTESARFKKDVSDLSKTKNIDKDLVKALNRRLDNEDSLAPKYEAYAKKISTMVAAKIDTYEEVELYVAEETRWVNYYKGALERGVNDIQEIANTLSERYGQTFAMNEFLVIQLAPQRIKAADSIIVELQKFLQRDTTKSTPPSSEALPIRK